MNSLSNRGRYEECERCIYSQIPGALSCYMCMPSYGQSRFIPTGSISATAKVKMPQRIALVGEMGAGKDTMASVLEGYKRIAFGDAIKSIARLIREGDLRLARVTLIAMCKYGGVSIADAREVASLVSTWALLKETAKDRKLVQEIGTTMRNIHDRFWIDHVLCQTGPDIPYVLTDCRRKSELEALKRSDFTLIYVEAPVERRKIRLRDRDGMTEAEFKEASEHAAEREIRGLKASCDYVLVNDTDNMRVLKERVENLFLFEGKNCINCKYHKLMYDAKPCVSCYEYKNWRPREVKFTE